MNMCVCVLFASTPMLYANYARCWEPLRVVLLRLRASHAVSLTIFIRLLWSLHHVHPAVLPLTLSRKHSLQSKHTYPELREISSLLPFH